MALASAPACGDDPISKTDAGGEDAGDVGGGDGLGEDGLGEDTADVAAPDDVPGDEGTPGDTDPGDVPLTDVVVNDVSDATDTTDTTQFPDLTPDTTSPTVTATTPAAGATGVATPFVVEVTFSEAMAKNTVVKQTFKVFDVNEQEVQGTVVVNEDGTKATFTPAAATVYHLASPYRVVLIGGTIKDAAGNPLVENFELSFFTKGFADMAAYGELAAKYAPTIYSGVDLATGVPQTQIPTTFDADGDWDGSDNQAWIATEATSVTPAVYYDVVESKTHYFIHYTFFFPWVNHPVVTSAHSNGAPGAMVTVEKARGEQPERPIAVTTAFKNGGSDESFVFVTNESGIVGPQGKGNYQVEESYAQETLFPGGRYEAFISPGRHESCLWIDTVASAVGFPQPCQLIEAQKATMKKLVFAYTDGTADPIVKDGTWPGDMADLEGEPEVIGYELVPLLDTLWPRRLEVGDTSVFDSTYTYSAENGRPGDGMLLSSRFVNSLEMTGTLGYGRPLWNWRHDPATGKVNDTLDGDGVLGIDPAWYFWTRHKSVAGDNSIVPYDPITGAGFSVDYCFNPFTGQDVRATDPLCGAAE